MGIYAGIDWRSRHLFWDRSNIITLVIVLVKFFAQAIINKINNVLLFAYAHHYVPRFQISVNIS